MRQLSYFFRRSGATVVAAGASAPRSRSSPPLLRRRLPGGVDSVRGVVADYLDDPQAHLPERKCEKCGQGNCFERIIRHGLFLGCSCIRLRIHQDLSAELPEQAVAKRKSNIATTAAKEMATSAAVRSVSSHAYRRIARPRGGWSKHTIVRRQPNDRSTKKCPTCGEGLGKTRPLRRIIGCSTYPNEYTRPITLGIKCPKCHEGEFVRRAASAGAERTRIFYGCSRYPDAISRRRPAARKPCRSGGAPFIVEKKIQDRTVRACIKEGCDGRNSARKAPAATTGGSSRARRRAKP